MANSTPSTTSSPVAQAEAKAIEKHGDRVVAGTAQREPTGKVSVQIRTLGVDGNYDGKTRRVATSDLFQVFHQPEVKAQLAKAEKKERKAKAKADEVAAATEALAEALAEATAETA